MPFWSAEKLRNNLQLIIEDNASPKIEHSAIELRMGSEIYVTPHAEIRDPQSVTKQKLEKGKCFTIPAGQFAFLITEEKVHLPFNVMGFISIKTTIKCRGLVNVSGFHVDPGFRGRLVFSVFNAGPAPVHLQQGSAVFMLWIADLDESAQERDARKDGSNSEIPFGMSEIPLKLINNIPGEIHSLQSLSKRIDSTKDDLKEEMHKVKHDMSVLRTKITIWGGLIIGITTYLLRGPIVAEISTLMQQLHQPAQTTIPVLLPTNVFSKRNCSKVPKQRTVKNDFLGWSVGIGYSPILSHPTGCPIVLSLDVRKFVFIQDGIVAPWPR